VDFGLTNDGVSRSSSPKPEETSRWAITRLTASGDKNMPPHESHSFTRRSEYVRAPSGASQRGHRSAPDDRLRTVRLRAACRNSDNGLASAKFHPRQAEHRRSPRSNRNGAHARAQHSMRRRSRTSYGSRFIRLPTSTHPAHRILAPEIVHGEPARQANDRLRHVASIMETLRRARYDTRDFSPR